MTREIHQIRRENLELLIAEAGSASELARLSGTSPSYLSQVRHQLPAKNGSPRVIGVELAQKLEHAMGKHPGWIDRPQGGWAVREEGERYQPAAIGNSCPLLTWTEAGNFGKVKSDNHRTLIPCPIRCSADSFVLRVQDESMTPRFQIGDLIFVDPNAEPTPGRFVIVKIFNAPVVLLRQVIFESGELYLATPRSEVRSYLKYTDIVERQCGVVVFRGEIIP